MIDRLCWALEHIENLPPDIQEEIAERIEIYTEPFDIPEGTLAGSMPDLSDDAEETLLRWRREAPPTPSVTEQLRWLEAE